MIKKGGKHVSYSLNEKIKDLKPYDPIQGEYQIRLDANESFLSVPNEILEQFHTSVNQIAFNRYPDPYANATITAFGRHYGVKSNLVTAGNGSDELIQVIMSAFLMKGDRVLTLSHDFSMYRFYTSIVEAECIEVPKNEDLTINVDNVIETANEKQVRMIIFSNPCNPTSLGLCKDEVRRLIRSVNALVILDEAYMDFWDQSLLQEAESYDNLIILRTCSKAFGMAAVRLGFAVANQTLTNAIRAVKSPYNVNTVTQAFGAAVLNQKELTDKAIITLLYAKKELFDSMKQLAQQYGFSVFPYTLDGQGDTAFPEALPVPPDVMQTFFPNIPVATPTTFLVNVNTLEALPLLQGATDAASFMARMDTVLQMYGEEKGAK